MNYFELYPGDYLRDTTRLSLLDHGAYMRLLMTYYSEEEPLPAAESELYGIVGATTAADKTAVRKIAARFFPVGADGLRHNARADAEISKTLERMEAAPVKKANQAERQRRAREHRKQLFEQLRGLGVTADFNATTTELSALLSQNVTRDSHTKASRSHSKVTRDYTATRPQTPHAIKDQEHELPDGNSSASPETGEPPDLLGGKGRKADPIPYQAIVDGYNATLTRLPKARELTPKRKTLIRTAWQASPQRRSLAFFRAYWSECEADDFLNGTGPYRPPHESFRPGFDYLLRADVVTRTFERALDRMDREQ